VEESFRKLGRGERGRLSGKNERNVEREASESHGNTGGLRHEKNWVCNWAEVGSGRVRGGGGQKLGLEGLC